MQTKIKHVYHFYESQLLFFQISASLTDIAWYLLLNFLMKVFIIITIISHWLWNMQLVKMCLNFTFPQVIEDESCRAM